MFRLLLIIISPWILHSFLNWDQQHAAIYTILGCVYWDITKIKNKLEK